VNARTAHVVQFTLAEPGSVWFSFVQFGSVWFGFGFGLVLEESFSSQKYFYRKRRKEREKSGRRLKLSAS
jgi:hypothetical protein